MPTPAKPLRVVGDLHLCAEDPRVVAAFLAWLEEIEGTGGTLVLLGDVFDLWIDDRCQHDPVPRRVLAALRRVAAAGTALVFMPGNRDVVFRGADDLDIAIWPDPVRTTLDDRTVLLTHGDQLCTADHGYQKMRRFIYSPPGQFLARLPLRVKRYLGQGVRGISRKETGKKPTYAMGLDYAEALRWMAHHEATALIAGHVHTGVHHRHVGPPEREILVLRDWQRGGSVIAWDGGALELRVPGSPA